MSTPERQELINNAVAFLADTKVGYMSILIRDTDLSHLLQTQASPVTQRIQFLEAKGLTPPEIDIALRQASTASANHSGHPPYAQSYGPNPYQYGVVPVHGAQRWDWRDYFVSLFVQRR